MINGIKPLPSVSDFDSALHRLLGYSYLLKLIMMGVLY